MLGTLSNSKLNCVITCPMTYYLRYEQGIKPRTEKPALAIGSAVHWGIEHNTEDLEDYFNESGSFKQINNFNKDQLLAESMVHGYLKHKDNLFEKILKDPETNEKLELVEEYHELELTAKLKSFKEQYEHDFMGIIDLLLLTTKGFIIIDYKTSTYEPDWSNYLDQIYRYVFLLKSNFPDIPVIKTGIINIRKTSIRPKKNENDVEFFNRLKFEYDLNDENYVNYHEFLSSDINEELYKEYIENLAKTADLAKLIVDNKMWYINYKEANGQYGKSDYWDIFYQTPNAEQLYTIRDTIWDKDSQSFVSKRDCLPLDMQVISNKNVLNKYDIFKKNLLETKAQSKEEFFSELAESCLVDINLLNVYWETYIREKEVENNAG